MKLSYCVSVSAYKYNSNVIAPLIRRCLFFLNLWCPFATLQSLSLPSFQSFIRNFVSSCSHHTSTVRTVSEFPPLVSLLPVRWIFLSHFSHCCTIFHSVEALHRFSTISFLHHNFSKLQDIVKYVCISLLLYIATAHCFSSITTDFCCHYAP